MTQPQVRLVDHFGSDARVVNAARVSYAKSIPEAGPISDSDRKLLLYLARHGHMSPFRHCFLTFHLRQPEFVARQAYKHAVGISATSDGSALVDSAWNEVSGRYVEFGSDSIWSGPPEWRGVPAAGQSKQGSTTGVFSEAHQRKIQDVYESAVRAAMVSYNALISIGVAREQARVVLPMSFMTEWYVCLLFGFTHGNHRYWTMSLEAAIHFCKLRMAPDSQAEIRQMAQEMAVFIAQCFPFCYDALLLV